MKTVVGIDQLIFKGTHNSYSCRGEGDLDPPCMSHPPREQIDGFAVWAVELDFSVVSENGGLTPVIGHDYAGHATCYGSEFPDWPETYRLVDFLRSIYRAEARTYRPVFIYFDIKTGEDSWGVGDYRSKLTLGIATVREVFGQDVIILEDYRTQHEGRYPTVPELAGKAVVFFPSPEFPRTDIPNSPSGTLVSTNSDKCTYPQVIERSIQTGVPVEGAANAPGGYRVFRLDQYQADWTFDYGVPPNPLVVDSRAQPPWTVTDSKGDEWDCSVPLAKVQGDVWKGEVVHEHGTFGFPYRTVKGAVIRAQGTAETGLRDQRRAGYGWTVLIRPGSYAETMSIDIPLTLIRDERFVGSVEIGR
jgi:hypothetical protein